MALAPASGNDVLRAAADPASPSAMLLRVGVVILSHLFAMVELGSQLSHDKLYLFIRLNGD
jgi:hypothetical protein